MVGVTWQTGDELKEFISKGYFKGDLFLDEQQKSYEVAGTSGISGAFTLFKSLVFGLSDRFRAKLKTVNGNARGITTVYSTIASIDKGNTKNLTTTKQSSLLTFLSFFLSCLFPNKAERCSLSKSTWRTQIFPGCSRALELRVRTTRLPWSLWRRTSRPMVTTWWALPAL